MTYYVHVNKNTIASNRKHGKKDPAVRIQKGRRGKPVYAYRVQFSDAVIEYKPDGEPLLPCGARLVIATEKEPIILDA